MNYCLDRLESLQFNDIFINKFLELLNLNQVPNKFLLTHLW